MTNLVVTENVERPKLSKRERWRLKPRKRRSIPPRATVLFNLVKEHGWKLGVELGVLDGRTYLYLLRRCRGLTMVGVDLWTSYPEKEAEFAEGGRSYIERPMGQYRKHVVYHAQKYGARSRLIRADTVQAAQEFEDGSVDFVFVDADHTYEAVLADIDAWLPKIRSGGQMLGHDWGSPGFPGVARAVRERFGEPRTYADYVWAVDV